MDNFYIFCAKYLIFIIVLAVFAFWLKQSKNAKLQLALTVVVGAVIAAILVKIAGKLYYDPRPFVVENIQPLVKHSADNGFPSEHATFSALLASSAYYFNRRLGLWLMLAAVLVGVGRIGAHVHSLTDVVAGLAFGSLSAWLAYKFVQKKQPAVKPAIRER